MLDLAFRPDRTRREPLYRQLADYLHGLIEAQRLNPGVKLPATRELAMALGINRNTVTQAYQDLLAQGLLTAHVGQGTFVADHPPAIAAVTPAGGTVPTRGFVWSGLFAKSTDSLQVPPRFLIRSPIRYDFRAGQVAVDALPVNDLRKALANTVNFKLEDLAGHVNPYGWMPLREEIARYLVGRGLMCDAQDVVVVNGAQQAIDMVARVLLDPGDTVVVEQPGYFGAVMAFEARQAHLVGVGVDAEGMRTDELARVLKNRRVKLIYTTPAAQFPTGAVMSEQRRRELLALADEHQTPIMEDDYDSELRYGGPPIAALKTMDAAGQVIYTGTFSKVLFPGIRVGHVVAAAPLLQKIALARWNADVATSVLMQSAVAELLSAGGFDRHLRRMRKLYAERLAAMLDALTACMPPGTRWSEPGGGHCVWVTLPEGANGAALFQAAVEAGIGYTTGESCYRDGRGQDCLLLSFANHPPELIAQGIERLATLVRHQLPGNGGAAA